MPFSIIHQPACKHEDLPVELLVMVILQNNTNMEKVVITTKLVILHTIKEETTFYSQEVATEGSLARLPP